MPVYEYRCRDCSTTFELLRPVADRELVAVCSHCESRTTMPLISRIAVRGPSAGAASSPVSVATGGGCCGGACGCG